MNREILFRGKRMDNGEWVYGDYHKFTCTTSGITPTPTHYIMGTDVNSKGQTWVDPDTIGQYTGLTDKNGVKIFEGDIVSIPGSKKMGLPAEVYYFSINGFFCLRRYGYSRICLENSDEWALIVGNIHDNPELLGGNDGTTD